MGKVSLSRPQPPTPEPTPEPKNLIPKLTKKELINVVVYTGGVLLIGFVIGLLSHPLFTTTHVVRFRSEFDQIQLDLENKLESTSKKLDGIEDEELRKLLTDSKKVKIDEIKVVASKMAVKLLVADLVFTCFITYSYLVQTLEIKGIEG